MYHNLNQLQWQLERHNFHGHDLKTYFEVLRTPFKKFLNSKEFKIKKIEKRLKERKIQEEESLVTKGTILEANLSTDGTSLEASLVYEGASLEASFVTDGIALDASLVSKQSTVDSSISSKQQNECNSSRNECSRSGNENRSFDNESSSVGNGAYADIGHSNDSDIVLEVHHDMFKNMFVHGMQNHEQPQSILDTYMVNENNSNIISKIPNIDQDIGKEEHNDVDYEQQRAFFAFLINNLKCDVEKYNKVNREAQKANALLINELERYKKKEKIFCKRKDD
ncbi:hypothetical protein Tco_0765211 [Tanacetum coccineum]